MDEQQSPVTPSPIYQESQDKNAKWLWLLIVLIIIGAIAFAYVKGIGPFSKLKFGGSGSSSSPSPISSPIARVSSPSPEATTASKNLDKSEPKIRVLNGTGKSGVASSAKDFIEGKGYKVVSIGNADTYDFERTFIRFKSKFKKFEELLTTDLSSKYSVRTSSDSLEASDSADIEVIIGNQ